MKSDVIEKIYPSLYKKNKRGKVQIYIMEVLIEGGVNGIPYIKMVSGLVDGKKTIKRKYIRKGVNKGKKNEKSPLEKAIFDADNIYKKKIEDNFVDSLDKVNDPPKYLKPMLAKDYSVKKVKYPCYGQYKLDGVRSFNDYREGNEVLYSRERNEFTEVDHIIEEVKNVKYPLDGEIYNHDIDFSDIISYVKRYQKGYTEKLKLYVYDIPLSGISYSDRLSIIKDIFCKSSFEYLEMVPTVLINSHEEMVEFHNKAVQEGYEGIILRDMDSEYKFNDREYCLMKYKEFDEDEFPIISVHYEEYYDDVQGRVMELIMFRCSCEGGEFDVRPKGEFSKRKKMYNDYISGKVDYVRKKLTIKYFGVSQDNIPRMPIGKAIRDYE